MRDTYSIYEAKARLSAIVRQVREGYTVVVTVHGEPVAEIRPIAPSGKTIDQHIAALMARGIVRPATEKLSTKPSGTPRPGALARFLKDR